MIKKESTTDSDSGLFVKGEHERCFAYSAQTACDRHGFVLDFEVGAGKVHDGLLFHELYKKMVLSRTKIVTVDASYKTPGVVREIFLSGKADHLRHVPKVRDTYKKRKETIERVFAELRSDTACATLIKVQVVLMPSYLLKELKAKSSSQVIPKRAFSTS